jgi:DNA-binding transcriptional regulator LsrR (DeoR family)
MYYIDGLKQTDIAKMLHISPMGVSRMLKRAEEEGLVSIQVRAPTNIDLESGRKLRVKYPMLKEAIVIHDDGEHVRRRSIGMAAAQYVADILVPDAVIGLSWGKTISEFAGLLQPQTMPHVKVAQLTGGFLCSNDYLMMPSSIVKLASENLHCDALFFSAPMFVASLEAKKQMINDNMNNYVLQQARKSHVNIIGLSPLQEASTISKVEIVTEKDRRELLDRGAVGDVAGFFVNDKGDEIEWSKSQLYVGVDLKTISSAPHVVCLAAERNKARIVDLAIRRKYCNILITTDALANELITGNGTEDQHANA